MPKGTPTHDGALAANRDNLERPAGDGGAFAHAADAEAAAPVAVPAAAARESTAVVFNRQVDARGSAREGEHHPRRTGVFGHIVERLLDDAIEMRFDVR